MLPVPRDSSEEREGKGTNFSTAQNTDIKKNIKKDFEIEIVFYLFTGNAVEMTFF